MPTVVVIREVVTFTLAEEQGVESWRSNTPVHVVREEVTGILAEEHQDKWFKSYTPVHILTLCEGLFIRVEIENLQLFAYAYKRIISVSG